MRSGLHNNIIDQSMDMITAKNRPKIENKRFSRWRPRALELCTEIGILKKKDDMAAEVSCSWEYGFLFGARENAKIVEQVEDNYYLTQVVFIQS